MSLVALNFSYCISALKVESSLAEDVCLIPYNPSQRPKVGFLYSLGRYLEDHHCLVRNMEILIYTLEGVLRVK